MRSGSKLRSLPHNPLLHKAHRPIQLYGRGVPWGNNQFYPAESGPALRFVDGCLQQPAPDPHMAVLSHDGHAQVSSVAIVRFFIHSEAEQPDDTGAIQGCEEK